MTAVIAATVAIAVAKLEIDPKNVRKSYSVEGVRDLAANIEANGLLQNLVVRPAEKKRHFYVTAGGRRLRALQLLIEEKRLPKTYQVNCVEREEKDALEISLSENMMREAMHPLDQFDAFSNLAGEGKPVADIAARYGVSETIVKRRLALAKVHPDLRDLYRQGKMEFDALTAFTVTEDQAEQLRVWESLPQYNRHASMIRKALAGEESVRSTDKRVVYIGGLEVFEQAGGSVVRDLFDDQGGGFITDVALLDKLVADKMETEAATVKAEGWSWVEVLPEWDYNHTQGFKRRYPSPVVHSADDQAELDRLTEALEALEAVIEAGDDDGGAETEAAEIEAKIKLLSREDYSAEDYAKGGAFLTITHQGSLRVERGFYTEEAKPQADDVAEDAAPALVQTAALTEDLTAQKTAALRVEMAKNNTVALAAVVHAMLLNVAYAGYGAMNYTSLEMRLTHTQLEGSMKSPDQSKALAALEELAEGMKGGIPKNPADLWDWCIDLTPPQLLSLLAFAASHSINAVEAKGSYRHKDQLAHANQVGAALGTDMRDYWQPTADSYFGHLNRNSIQAAVAEVKGEDFAKGVAEMKKKEAAAYAEKAVKGTDWLPSSLLFVPAVSEIEAELAISQDGSADEGSTEEGFDESEGDEIATAEIVPFPQAAE